MPPTGASISQHDLRVVAVGAANPVRALATNTCCIAGTMTRSALHEAIESSSYVGSSPAASIMSAPGDAM